MSNIKCLSGTSVDRQTEDSKNNLLLVVLWVKVDKSCGVCNSLY